MALYIELKDQLIYHLFIVPTTPRYQMRMREGELKSQQLPEHFVLKSLFGSGHKRVSKPFLFLFSSVERLKWKWVISAKLPMFYRLIKGVSCAMAQLRKFQWLTTNNRLPGILEWVGLKERTSCPYKTAICLLKLKRRIHNLPLQTEDLDLRHPLQRGEGGV